MDCIILQENDDGGIQEKSVKVFKGKGVIFIFVKMLFMDVFFNKSMFL